MLNSHKIQRWKSIESAFKRKQIFLCEDCYFKIYNNSLDVNELNLEMMFTIKSKI
jgi:hypothetical protein